MGKHFKMYNIKVENQCLNIKYFEDLLFSYILIQFIIKNILTLILVDLFIVKVGSYWSLI